MGSMSIIFGIEGLDKTFKNILQPPLMLVVAGHPGSGKTIFSSTICYANSSTNNAKCLYVSLQEDKDKFYRFMKNVGMDFSILEEKGIFRFIKIPVMLEANVIAENIAKEVSEFQPKTIVIDSITAVMQGIKDEEKRAWIQNYFYELSKVIQGIVILIAEIPLGQEVASLGSIEFIADAVFILKYRVENGFLSRYMEIRKIRGAPITLAEIPFSISEGGIKVWAPVILSEIKHHDEKIHLYCRFLKDVIGYITKDSIIYIEYPPDFRIIDLTLIPIAVLCANNLKALLISYRYPPTALEDLIKEALAKVSIDEDKAIGIIRKHLNLRCINPFSQSITQLYAEELEYISNEKPDMVIFYGTELPALVTNKSEYIPKLYNQLNTLRAQGCVVVRFATNIDDELSRINSAIADVVMRVLPISIDSGEQKYKLYVWRKGRKAYVMSYEEVSKCLQDLGEVIKQSLASAPASGTRGTYPLYYPS